jgi:hypothetical protein
MRLRLGGAKLRRKTSFTRLRFIIKVDEAQAENAKLREALAYTIRSCLVLAICNGHQATERAMRELQKEWRFDP